MQTTHEGMTFNHMAEEKDVISRRPSVSQILLFVAEETIAVMLLISMIFLM